MSSILGRPCTATLLKNAKKFVILTTTQRSFHLVSFFKNELCVYDSCGESVISSRRHVGTNAPFTEGNSNDDVEFTNENESNKSNDINNDTEPTTDTTPIKSSTTDQLESQIQALQEQLQRSTDEHATTRRIGRRDVQEANSFAVASFAKSLLETSDNLARAMEAVPVEYHKESDTKDVDKSSVLSSLYNGIKKTESSLLKTFRNVGVEKFGKVGDTFDPNQHEALCQYADDSKPHGTVGQVMKVGFILQKRVIRPAEVGIVKNAC